MVSELGFSMSTFVLFGVVDIIVSERRRECDDVPVLGHEDLNDCSIPIDFSVDVDHVGYMFVFVRLVIRLVIATQQYPRNLNVLSLKHQGELSLNLLQTDVMFCSDPSLRTFGWYRS